MKTIAYDYGFRFDLGEQIGSGHFYRCLALADELIKKKKKVVFFVSDINALTEHMNLHIPYIVLNGKTEKRKIYQMMKYSNSISHFVIDLPHSVSLYSQLLPSEQTIILDDTGKKNIFSKLLINFQLPKEFHKYFYNRKTTKLLKGRNFVILRKEISGKKQPTRKNNIKLKKILISISSKYFNKKIMKQFEYLIKHSNYDFTLLLRPSLKISKNFQNLSQNNNVKIIKKISNPKQLYRSHDLIISHPGMTIYELAYIGIPCIMLHFNKQQKILASEFARIGFGLALEYSTKFATKLLLLINNLEDLKLRNKMTTKGQTLIDGRGLDRIITIFLK